MIISDEKVEQAFEFLVKTAKEYAQAKADERHLEKHEKKLLAELKSKSSEDSDAAKTREAYCMSEYTIWQEGYKDAVYKLAELETRRENAHLAIDIWRTESANTRRM